VDRERAALETAEQFIAAIVSRDAVAITSLMSSKAQAELLDAVRRWVPAVGTPEQAAARVFDQPWTDVFAPGFEVESVEIDGERATVAYRHRTYGRDDDDVFRLADIGGRWLVDEFPDDHDDDDKPPWAFDRAE
jgi:hypothetical protein